MRRFFLDRKSPPLGKVKFWFKNLCAAAFCLLGIRVKFQKLSGFKFCVCSSSSLVGIEFDPIALEKKCLSSRLSRVLSPCAHTPPNNTMHTYHTHLDLHFGWRTVCVCPAHHCVQIDPLNYHPFFYPGPKINRGRGFSPLGGGMGGGRSLRSA